MIENCFIWNTAAEYKNSSRDGRIVISPRAGGRYFISGTALAIIGSRPLPEKQRVVLSDWVFRQNQLGIFPELTSEVLKWSASSKIKNTTDRAHGLLLSMGAKTSFIGETLNWFGGLHSFSGADDIPELAYAASSSTKVDEVIYLARHLFEGGLISDYQEIMGFQIEPKGFEYLDNTGTFDSEDKQVFVAMWFNKEIDNAYQDGISEAIRQCGYTPFRIDEKNHNNKIDDEIMSEIKKSKFVVADFTSGFASDGTLIARGGVYYEAGFAQGLGLQVIWTCHEDCIDHVHFDTRQYNHIVWTNSKDLHKKLADRINATIV